MTFELKGLLIVAIYKWLLPASYVVFLTTLVLHMHANTIENEIKLEAHEAQAFIDVQII